MARPIKKGLDYFPLDVVMDSKIELIEAEFKLKGFAVVIKLFQQIYGGEGYFYKWDNDVALMFADKINAGVNVVSEIVKRCFDRGIFDSTMFEKYGILTSEGIQKRYAHAKRGCLTNIKSEYLLINAPIIEFSAAQTEVSAAKTPINAAEMPQSKAKESKINNNKTNENKINNNKINDNKTNNYTAAVAVNKSAAISYYTNNIDYNINPVMLERINAYSDILGSDVVIYAMQEAVYNNVRRWSYIEKILQSYEADGVRTVEQARARKRQFMGKHTPMVKQTPFNSYEQRDYSNAELEEIIRRKNTANPPTE